MATATLLGIPLETETTGTSYNTPSVTWGAAVAGLLVVATRETNNPTVPTITGGWSTWTPLRNGNSGTVAGGAVWVGTGTKTDQAININYGADMQLMILAAVFGLADCPASGTILNVGTWATATGTSISPSISSAASDSLLIGVVMHNNNNLHTSESGWAEATDLNVGASFFISMVVATRAGNADLSYTASWTTSVGAGGCVLELLHEASGPAAGTGSGTWTFVGTAAGQSDHAGTGTGTWTFVGTAAGTTTRTGTGTGTWAFTGTAAGSTVHQGASTGTWTYAGTATGATQHEASGTGTWAWAGEATGTAPVVGGASGSTTGAWTLVGTATGAATHQGTSAGSWTFTGTSSGTTDRTGSTAGAWSYAGTGQGHTDPAGTATGTLSWHGTAAAGVVPPRTGSTTLVPVLEGSTALTASPAGSTVVTPKQPGGTELVTVGAGDSDLDTGPGGDTTWLS